MAWLTAVLEQIVSGRIKAHETHTNAGVELDRHGRSQEAEPLAAQPDVPVN